MSETTMEPTGEEPETGGLGIGELLAGIPELLRRMEDTEDTVAGLVAELANYPAGGPWLWDGLTPQAQRELWVELDTFVVWLQNRILCHHMSKDSWIPPCWYRHPDAVEQLTALMVAHKASYHPKTEKPSHALVDWFHKCLWPTMDTLKQRMTLKQCLSKKEHEEPYMAGLNLVAGAEDFTTFVDATVSEIPANAVPESSGAAQVDTGTGEIIEPSREDDPAKAQFGRHG